MISERVTVLVTFQAKSLKYKGIIENGVQLFDQCCGHGNFRNLSIGNVR